MNRAFEYIVRRSTDLAHAKYSPKNISASEIRKSFIDYFCRDNGHLYLPSSRVFSLKDPTLAFTNAGMNQFKDVFLGLVRPEFTRVANYQKCIRIGGVHNDLNLVGHDGFHHTFFEMLGNWSFGDYFKEESCRMSWDLLTKVYCLPTERLYVTYFGGDKALGLDADVEVYEIWRKIGVEESHILPFGSKENFWIGSLIGPCGPCTEIHYDLCPGRRNAEALVNTGTSEVTELWNLVFMQYYRESNDKLIKLKTHFVDTGMGFERLVAVLQGKKSNYDTDLFLPLFEVIKKCSGHSGYTGMYDLINSGYRILADHSRMITFALSDGMIPNHQNKVRGIIRKAFFTAEKIFNAKPDLLLKELTTQVVQIMSHAYPEIEKNLPKIHYIIENEINVISHTMKVALNRWAKIKQKFPGLQDLDVAETPQIVFGLDYIDSNILSKGKNSFSGEDIFVLYDTYGIPPHVTEQIASKLNLRLNIEDYKNYELSKKSGEKKELHQKYLENRSQSSYLDVASKLEEKEIHPTSDYFKYDYRVDSEGKYFFKNQPTTIEAILLNKNLVNKITAEDIQEEQEIGLILDRTQLFSEEGGQSSDKGTLEIENEIIFDIHNVVKAKGFVLHFGRFKKFPWHAEVTVQNIGIIKLDEERRLNVMRNHTALHLVNAFLREELSVVGEKFSKVTKDDLSLKYMVYKKFLHELEDVEKLEKYVRDFINHGVSVKRKIFNISDFHSLEDVVFIPGETILESEIPVIEINSGFKVSREYCTGTHVLHVSDLQDFIVMKYLRGSYNLHTIEAVTGEKCLEVRNADSKLKKDWFSLEKEFSECGHYSPSKMEDLLNRIEKFSAEMLSSKAISHLVKFRIKAAVKEVQKKCLSLKKLCVRNYLAEELKKASSETPEKFLVYSFEHSWNFDPSILKDAASSVADKPLFVVFKGEYSSAVQCIVPEAFVSPKFSALKWLTGSVMSLGGGIGRSSKNDNSDLTFFIHDTLITEDQFHRIIEAATYFGKKNLRN